MRQVVGASAGPELAPQGLDHLRHLLPALLERAVLLSRCQAVDAGTEALEVRERLALAADRQQRARQPVVRLEVIRRGPQELPVPRDRRVVIAEAQGQRGEVALRLRLVRVAAQRLIEVVARAVEVADRRQQRAEVRVRRRELRVEVEGAVVGLARVEERRVVGVLAVPAALALAGDREPFVRAAVLVVAVVAERGGSPAPAMLAGAGSGR